MGILSYTSHTESYVQGSLYWDEADFFSNKEFCTSSHLCLMYTIISGTYIVTKGPPYNSL